MQKILLIGSSGYIGSKLYLTLKDNYELTGVDIGWFNKPSQYEICKDFDEMDQVFIRSFNSVILLAGHSSVKMCENDIASAFNNNVRNFQNLINKMLPEQKLIYASSSSVYGMAGNEKLKEDYDQFTPHNVYDVTKHLIDILAQRSKVEYYGLRFGTVNGYSPNVRNDVMINSMVYSAVNNKEIKLYIKDIIRPILGIDDLVRAVETILYCNDNKKGLYNLASFSHTAENIANKVSEITKIPVVHYESDPSNIKNAKLETKCYNFDIDCSKFKDVFDFEFKDTIESITKNILANYSKIKFTNRSDSKKYE